MASKIRSAMNGMGAAILVCAVLIGCNKPDNPIASSSNSPESASSAASPTAGNTAGNTEAAGDAYQKFDPPIVLTQGMRASPDLFIEGHSVDNNAYTEWSKNVAGVVWKSKWNAPDDESHAQKLTLAIASNDLPDLMYAPQEKIQQMAKAKQIIPLDDLLKNNQSDIVKYIYEEANRAEGGNLYKPFMYDNQIYGIPLYVDPVGPYFNWFRQDLLAELGAAVPTTLDEFESVLRALKTKYPDTLGVVTGKTGTTPLVLDAYGAFPDIWQEADGKLVYGSVQPQVKEALARLSEWYKAGYIDKEFVVSDQEAKWAAGNVFAYTTGWWLNWGSNLSLDQNVDTAQLSVMPYLPASDGFIGRFTPSGASKSAFVISARTEHPEAIFALNNWQMDSAFRNYEDLTQKFAFKYPPEPVQEPINQAELDELKGNGANAEQLLAAQKFNYTNQGPDKGDTNGFFNTYTNHGVRFGMRFNQRAGELKNAFLNGFTAMKNGTVDQLSPYDYSIYKQAYDNWGEALCLAMLDGLLIMDQFRDKVVRDQFFGAPTPTMVTKQAYLLKIRDETFTKIIMGEQPISYFDEFVAQWYGNGGEEITKEVNEWYAASK